ncbi:MAG TPA: hypothetical protein VHT04_09805 [Stellaceae bacterium]|nr:hypothetical protein [Stellaceae bacterium]
MSPGRQAIAMNRVLRRIAAALGLMLGIGPALLANLFPQFAVLNQFGAVALGAILGMRAGERSPMEGDRPLDAADATAKETGGERRVL